MLFFAAYSDNSVNRSKTPNLKHLQADEDDSQQCVCKWPFIIATVIVSILFLTFLITFIIFPVIFKCSPQMQTDLIFPIGTTYVDKYSSFQKHTLGFRNLYVALHNKDGITLGLWHIVPEELIENSTLSSFNYNDALLDSKHPVLMYFHGAIGNRMTNANFYKVARKFFHVIAFDYRCYGDSSRGELSENDIVEDSVALYKWLRSQTNAKIYVWGYSLGCVLATHTVAKLKSGKSNPTGMFLEAAFPTMKDQLHYQMSKGWFTKLLTFMPWFESTMLKPFDDHGFNYNTTEYVVDVDCPIAIIHAQDDINVPFLLGFKLFDNLKYTRNHHQGNVSFYGLTNFYKANERNVAISKLMAIIRIHINACEQFKQNV